MAAYVMEAVPVEVGERREFDSLQFGPQESVNFYVTHPEVPEGKPSEGYDHAFRELFEARNDTIADIVDAAKAGQPIRMVCTRLRVAGQNGKRDWFKWLCVKVLS